jgi:hypothetical protein
MPSIQITSKVSFEDLFNGVKSLKNQDFEQFVEKIMQLKAQRQAEFIPTAEADLLAKINQSLSVEVLERYQVLQTKRSEEVLTEREFQELSDIVEQKELLNAERLKYLGELAIIRRKSLREVMQELDLLNNE